MNKPKELKWGETPFDHMTHEELLVHAKRMHMALGSAHNELDKMRQMTLQVEPNSLYWTGKGSGNKAYQRTEQALHKADAGYQQGDIYHNYYRYAESFLFDPYPGNEKDDNYWVCCSGCDTLQSATADSLRSMVGETHAAIFHGVKCQGTLKQFTEADMKPKA